MPISSTPVRRVGFTLLTGALTIAPALGLTADASPSAAMEEVLVTADFRSAPLLDLPGSISVIDSSYVDTRGATHLDQLLNIAPNVNFSIGGSRARFVQMRGVGDLEQFVDPKHYPAVGILTDGLALSNIAAGAVLLDVAQVEVLRGPQGTRFGAGALAGVVNIRGNDPGDTHEIETWGSYARFNTWQTGGLVSGPITDALRGRLAVQQTNSDGFMENAFLGGAGTQDIDELAARGKFIWTPRADLNIDLTLLHLDADNGYDAFSLDNSRTTFSDTPGVDAQNTSAVGITATQTLNADAEIVFNISYATGDETYAYDEDWTYPGFCLDFGCDPAFEYIGTDEINRQRQQLALDLRWIGSLNLGALDGALVAGAFFHDRDEDLVRNYFGRFTSSYETRRLALYGEYDLGLTDDWRLRLGLRGERFADDYRDNTALTGDASEFNLTGEVTLSWQASDAMLTYATLARGARPGSLNTSAVSSLPTLSAGFVPFIQARQRFATERLWNREIGMKGQFLDNRLNLRLAAFHMHRKNAQLESFLFDPVNFQFVSYLDNAPDVTSWGLEVEGMLAVSDRLALTTSLGHLKSAVDGVTVFDLDTQAFRAVNGRDQAKSPAWQFFAGLRWQATDRIDAGISAEGRAENYFGYYHDAKLGGYTTVNADAGLALGPIDARLFVRNLLNEDYAQHGLYFGNDPRDGFANKTYRQRAEPRTVGIMLRASFDGWLDR